MDLEKLLENGIGADCFDSGFIKDFSRTNVFGEGNGNVFYIKDYQQLCKRAYLGELLLTDAGVLDKNTKEAFEFFLNDLIQTVVQNKTDDKYSGDIFFPGSKFFSLKAKNESIPDLELNFVFKGHWISLTEWKKYKYDLEIVYKDYVIFSGRVLMNTEYFFHNIKVQILGIESMNGVRLSLYSLISKEKQGRPEATLNSLYLELKRYQRRTEGD